MHKSYRIFLLAALSLAAILTACVPSLHPLYTAETTVFRDDLLGLWKESAQSDESWKFQKEGENSYRVTYVNEKDSSEMEGRLVKLGEFLFLDLFISGESLNSGKLGVLEKTSLIPGHLVVKVRLGEKLELQALNPETLADHLSESPKALAHAYPQKDRLVITASTEDLQKFFTRHANTEGFWSAASNLKRVKI